MSCDCKNETVNKTEIKSTKTISNYILKTIIFLLFLVILPIVVVAIIWIVFKMLVLSESIDIKSILMSLYGKIKKTQDDDDEVSEDDLYMVDVEDITNKKF